MMESPPEDKMAKVRAAKKPPAYKNIHEDVKALPEDNTLSVKNVKAVSDTHLTLPTNREV